MRQYLIAIAVAVALTCALCISYACILYALSNSVHHATTWDDFPTRTSSQGARSMYSSKLLALKALRHQLERDYAETLASIDMQIEEEKVKP